jgi:hypothetical protein
VTNDLLKNTEQPFGLNGLALTPDGKYLIASVMDRLDAGDGRLVRIAVNTKEVVNIELQNNNNNNNETNNAAVAGFAGSDGMFFHDGSLFMVNVYSSAGAIYRATFTEEYDVATLSILDAFQNVYNRPTASALVGNTFWTVQSQLDHIIDDENGALGTPPDLPFQIVGVPFDTLISESTSPISAPSAPTPVGTAPSASPPTSTSAAAENGFSHYSSVQMMIASAIFMLVIVGLM